MIGAIARLAVLPIIVAPSPDVNASKVFAAVDEAAQLRRTLRVMSIDDYFFHEGGELANRALACGEDTACIAKQLAPFDADLGLVVIINPKLDPPLLSLLLIDTKAKTVAAEAYPRTKSGEIFETLRTEAEKLFDKRGFGRAGRLMVRVDPSRATITIDGAKPDVGTPNRYTLEAGTYEVRAEAEGFAPKTAQAVVTSGMTAEVALTLEPDEPIYASPWFWAAGAAVVVGTAVGVGFATLSSSTDCVCALTADTRECTICR